MRGEVAARRGEWEEVVEEEETSTTSMGEEVIRSRGCKGGLERRTEGGVARAMVGGLLGGRIRQEEPGLARISQSCTLASTFEFWWPHARSHGANCQIA